MATFRGRPVGSTLRREREALHRPHDPQERQDPEFPIAYKCEACGKVGYGPRRLLSEAVREHNEHCSARRNTEEHAARIFFPRI
jgi:hypothetical protein